MLAYNHNFLNGLPGKNYGVSSSLLIYSLGSNFKAFETHTSSAEIAGIPNGATHPASWMLPTKPGGIASYTGATITSSASAATTPPTVVNRTASANVAATGSGTLTATARIFTDLEFIRRGLGPYTVDVYNI
jgi:hypothetical protein